MRDMRVVELVESVLVEVLGIRPEEVVPYASVPGDLGARPDDVRTLLRRLRHVLPSGAHQRLTESRNAGPGGSFTVEDVVSLIESRTRYLPAPVVAPGQAERAPRIPLQRSA